MKLYFLKLLERMESAAEFQLRIKRLAWSPKFAVLQQGHFGRKEALRWCGITSESLPLSSLPADCYLSSFSSGHSSRSAWLTISGSICCRNPNDESQLWSTSPVYSTSSEEFSIWGSISWKRAQLYPSLSLSNIFKKLI